MTNRESLIEKCFLILITIAGLPAMVISIGKNIVRRDSVSANGQPRGKLGDLFHGLENSFHVNIGLP